jgi:peroxiredoxin
MAFALLASRVLLAGVFLLAGAAKLADRTGSRKAIVDFGLPAPLAPALGLALPLAEMAVGVALLPRALAWWGALGALALVLLFVGGIGYNMARGRTPDCHCFGQVHSEPVGWRTLARNGGLGLVAALVVWQGRSDPGPSVLAPVAALVAWFGALSLAGRLAFLVGVVVLALALAEGWLLFHLLRQHGRLLLRLDALEATLRASSGSVPTIAPATPSAPPPQGLMVGSAAPAFRLSGLYGETLTLDALRASGKPVLLLFVDPGCGPCTALLPEVGRWQRQLAGALTLAVISRGTIGANQAKAAEYGLAHVLLQEDREVSDAYKAYGTPSIVLVRPDATIGSSLASGAEAIRALVTQATGRLPLVPPGGPQLVAMDGHGQGNGQGNGHAMPTPVMAAKRGDLAPEVSLPDVDGKTVRLADFHGHETLVLFWNPGCGFCQRMLEDLKAWETNPPNDAPKLVVVSSGAADATRAQGLRSPVLLEPAFATARAFGASGTPSAVLVDANGRIASEVAVGAQAVLALASVEPVAAD